MRKIVFVCVVAMRFAWADGTEQPCYENGEQKEYYPSGQIKISTHFKDEKRDGMHEEWYENGVLSLRVSFSEGLRDGQTGEWYEDGTAKLDGYFQLDQPDGVQSEWYENGQLKRRSEFCLGEKQGWQREWSDAGDLLSEALYEKDRIQGTVTTWWSKDQIKTRFVFADGKKEGIHQWYHPNGAREKLAVYKNDLLDGELLTWYEDGSMQSIQSYCQGTPVGEHFAFFPKTDPTQTDLDRLAHVVCYDEAGRLHGTERNYFTNGNIQSLLSYNHGLMDNVKRLYNQNGELIEEATYVQGELNGPYYAKSADGREVFSHYRDHLLDGLVVEYSEGVKMSETPYMQGKKEGLAKHFGPDGEITLTIAFVADEPCPETWDNSFTVSNCEINEEP